MYNSVHSVQCLREEKQLLEKINTIAPPPPPTPTRPKCDIRMSARDRQFFRFFCTKTSRSARMTKDYALFVLKYTGNFFFPVDTFFCSYLFHSEIGHIFHISTSSAGAVAYIYILFFRPFKNMEGFKKRFPPKQQQ